MAGQRQLDLNRLVFIDEAGAKTNMTRLYGRAEKGERVVDLAPHGHWCTTTMISSIRLNGTTACMAVDGSTTGDVFRAYTEYVLVPALRFGDIVVLDNLASHKDPAGRCGSPVSSPYSPDLNPIEKMWSKIKQILCSVVRVILFQILEAIRVHSRFTSRNCGAA